MNNLKYHSVLICFLTILFACSNNNSEIHKKISTKNFDDIIQDVEFAITENNFRVVNRLNIGESIQERKEKKTHTIINLYINIIFRINKR